MLAFDHGARSFSIRTGVDDRSCAVVVEQRSTDGSRRATSCRACEFATVAAQARTAHQAHRAIRG